MYYSTGAKKRKWGRFPEAGTRIDREKATKIYGVNGKGQKSVNLFYDAKASVVQGGGKPSEVMNMQIDSNPVSFPLDVWKRAADYEPRLLEMVLHYDKELKKTAECLRIEMSKAHAVGFRYRTSYGDRWGVPLRYWDILDAKGNVIVGGEDAMQMTLF
jgi:hypothetical protein